jgi:hypothetical protein
MFCRLWALLSPYCYHHLGLGFRVVRFELFSIGLKETLGPVVGDIMVPYHRKVSMEVGHHCLRL